MIDSNNENYGCTPKLVMQGEQTVSLNTVAYRGALTPLLEKISPRFGSVVGGEEVTFSGTGFVETTGDYEITIDGVDCVVSSATTTSVTCTTGPRTGLVESSLSIKIKDRGYMST